MDRAAEPVTRRLRLLAPAKINWTLEVLRVRPDGYHEIRSVLQTIGLCDVVTLSETDDIELVLSGSAGPLADDPPERNLAVRAAQALRARAGTTRGVRIELEKRIPVAAGLGGGSSDAAAVLRGCNELWESHQDETNLIEIAGEIGSDPPFFVVGGTASVSGRGEIVRPLPDAIAPAIMLATPREHHRGEKTAAMYEALSAAHFTEGEATLELEDVVRAQRALVDEELANVFERVLLTTLPETARAMAALQESGLTPHLAGSGPSFLLMLGHAASLDELAARITGLGFTPTVVRTLPRKAALKIEEI
jgi:4-diphosphocytidyl-2-C-methyl-D-erythritol kinase